LKPNLIFIGGVAALLAAASIVSVIRKRTLGTTLQLIGAMLLIIVVLTHVAESFDLLPHMGWGRPNTPGHYLDLASAIGGVALLVTGFCLWRREASINRL